MIYESPIQQIYKILNVYEMLGFFLNCFFLQKDRCFLNVFVKNQKDFDFYRIRNHNCLPTMCVSKSFKEMKRQTEICLK